MFHTIILLYLSFKTLCRSKPLENTVEKWGQYEYSAKGPDDSVPGMNPFVDVIFGAHFQHESGGSNLKIPGFYDGDGDYRVRFMPDVEGKWTMKTYSTEKSLRDLEDSFVVGPPGPGNRGQAKAFGDHSFRFENGEDYFAVGTTAYAWIHQHEPFPTNTLKTLQDVNTTFNKIRMTIHPEWYEYLHSEPLLYPYEGKPLTDWQFDRFHVPYWRNFEKRLQQLQDMGYINDLVLFNYHDHWGFHQMEAKYDDLYLRYMLARFSSLRSVWWCMANEWDFVNKTMDSWNRLFGILENEDPYQHERSMHQMITFYDHNVSAVTHFALQITTVDRLNEAKTRFVKKPYVVDECQYEGTIKESWGNLTPQEMTRRFWMFAANLAQTQHGETVYFKIGDEEVLWWSKGNVLRGDSPPRIRFYREYFADLPYSWSQLESHTLAPKTYALTNVGEDKSFYMVFWDGSTSSITVDLSPIYDEYDVSWIEYYDMKRTLVKTVPSGKFTMNAPEETLRVLDIRKKEN